jgi:hypothetical protein
MNKRRLSIVAAMVLAGGALVVGPPTLTGAAVNAGERGPNGELAAKEVSEASIQAIATAQSMSLNDARFLAGAGGAALVEFQASHQRDPDFGAVWVEYRPFTIHLRTTKNSGLLFLGLEKALGRSVERVEGGLSFQQLNAEGAIANNALQNARTLKGQPPRYEVHPDSKTGVVRVKVNRNDAIALKGVKLPDSAVVTEADVEPYPTASYSGSDVTLNGQPKCTVAYAMKMGTSKGVVTAAHCPNSGLSSYGQSLGTAFAEQCQGIDRQGHYTTGSQLWNGFFDLYHVWTSIAAIAGGFYNGQPFFRSGQTGSAMGIIEDPQWIDVGKASDPCGVQHVYAFALWNYPAYGPPVQLGDSGGPVFFLYANQWFLGAQVTSVGVQSSGRAVMIDVPPGWTACTNATPC